MFSELREFLQGVVDNFGLDFALLLVSVYGVLKGAVSLMTTSAALPFFKGLGIEGDKYQSYGTVARTPWAMKALIGMMSDAMPLFGYHKRSYMLIVSVVGTIAMFILGTVQLSPKTAAFGAFLLFLHNLHIAGVDLLTEGKYAELMVAKPETGSSLVSFAWGLMTVGNFVGSSVGGPMADYWNPRLIFLICVPLVSQVIGPIAVGWLPEERLPPERRGIHMDKVRKHINLFKLSIAMCLASLAIGVAALLYGGFTQSMVSLVAAVAMCILSFRWLPKMLRRANLYLFLANVLYVSVKGATDYWFTADETCVPGGPHFSFTYYNTYASLVASAASGVGIMLFQKYLSRGTFRRAFCVTLILKLFTSFCDIAIVQRVNKRIGVPDSVAFMLGDAVIYNVAIMMDYMPAIVLTSKACPKGMEASVYALLASFQNLGASISNTLGVWLIDKLEIKTTVPCNFSRLTLGLLVAHFLLPSLILPFLFILIPDLKMTDEFYPEDDEDDVPGDGFQAVPTEERSGELGANEEGDVYASAKDRLDSSDAKEEKLSRVDEDASGATKVEVNEASSKAG